MCKRTHLGDPCIHCGRAQDEIGIGPCEARVQVSPGNAEAQALAREHARELGHLQAIAFQQRERAEKAEAEVAVLQETVVELQEQYKALEEVRQPGTCECGDDEACRFVRERDAAIAKGEAVAEALRVLMGELWCVEEGLRCSAVDWHACGCETCCAYSEAWGALEEFRRGNG